MSSNRMWLIHSTIIIVSLVTILTYTGEQLIGMNMYNVAPLRPISKAIFTLRLWQLCVLRECARIRWKRMFTSARSSATNARSPMSTTTNNKPMTLGLLNVQSVGNKSVTIATLIDKNFYVFLLTENWHTTSDNTALRRSTPPTPCPTSDMSLGGTHVSKHRCQQAMCLAELRMFQHTRPTSDVSRGGTHVSTHAANKQCV